MNRKQFLSLTSMGILGGLCSPLRAATQGATRETSKKRAGRPNVIFVQTDSWDGRVLGCLGHAPMKRATPHVDRLAERGVMFRNAYSSHPICCPSRANLWSGRYTYHCESWNNYKGLEAGTDTLLEHLRAAGYQFPNARGGLGKLDYLSGSHTQLARVSAWTGPADIQLPVIRMGAPVILESDEARVHQSDWAAVDRARRFLSRHAHDPEPFFLYVGIEAPHPAFRTSRRYLSLIERDAISVPPEDKELHPVMKYQRITKNWTHGFDRESVLRTRAIYYAMCAETDAMVGALVQEMERLGLADNTVFIFTSDHGENNMEHHQWYKMNMYESSARVPLIMAGPGIQRGKMVDNLVSLIDLYPTLAEMTGARKPAELDGESLVPLLSGKSSRSRNTAFAMFSGCTSNTTMYMWRRGEWKYVAYPGYGPQLFNLKTDPEEIDNLAARRPEVVAKMDEELRRQVDYPAVHRRVIDYDKASFRRWRDDVKAHPIPLHEYGANKEAATYDEVMANCYVGWTAEHEKKLEAWLAEG